ncbi:MAG: universal stress protein [Casimicrobiaceae bacterium]
MLRKVLVPVDGAAGSDRVIRSLIQKQTGPNAGEPIELHLLNVQQPVAGDVRTFVADDDIKDYHRDAGAKALHAARQALDGAGVPYRFHISVGNPAEIIARFAQENKCDEIFMGTRGHSGMSKLLLGSVASDVIRLANVPVTLVK